MRLMLACGGTGGHMFPALALADEFSDAGDDVMMVTDSRGIGFVPSGLEARIVPSTAFFGRSVGDKFRSIAGYFKGKKESLELIDTFSPQAVIGAGGYASFPVIRAAKKKRIPIFLLEQNSVPGRVTRLCASSAREIYLGIPVVEGVSLKARTVFTGNVLRRSVILVSRKEGKKILVLGGSGGARRLNYLGYELAQKFPREKFIILTGRRDYPELKARPPLANLELVEFTSHPEELYTQTRVAISRAGAITLSELLVNGIPSILVPFPHAVDDHQLHNALWAHKANAAVMVPEQEIKRAEPLLKELIKDKALRKKMGEQAHGLVPQDAARVIRERIEKCLAA
ncbi:hypothetical protein GF359_06605 [candidate division WOR-3 bacterium]|uniref:UDP-N-acetylglucosamine--N-acetylmuramyl-(pentapeptide) pyrophosphoryl-undecaprenol N-acetylglucosamine transferase n=1 Tax=candidate division WOR-3 bacterium TaxID=2052148 RepID=A0A9D5K9Z6_UNCW3|nr:hypothetical protein [candidate division WOR-3 bacterium]MBD3364869.1 hypothetical protein [candidate division WOR-3 bacterium]